jgi:hypothetical protein
LPLLMKIVYLFGAWTIVLDHFDDLYTKLVTARENVFARPEFRLGEAVAHRSYDLLSRR